MRGKNYDIQIFMAKSSQRVFWDLCSVSFVLCSMSFVLYSVLCALCYLFCVLRPSFVFSVRSPSRSSVPLILCSVSFVLFSISASFVLCPLFCVTCPLFYVLCLLFCVLCSVFCVCGLDRRCPVNTVQPNCFLSPSSPLLK